MATITVNVHVDDKTRINCASLRNDGPHGVNTLQIAGVTVFADGCGLERLSEALKRRLDEIDAQLDEQVAG